MKMNWYKKIIDFIESKCEWICVLLAIPVMLVYVAWEWIKFELAEKIRTKVARLFK